MKSSLVLTLLLLILSIRTSSGATYTVTTAGDAGPGSLRQAILDANASPNAGTNQPDIINFDIPQAGTQTVLLATALPPITEAVTIDGYTQSDAQPNTVLALGNDAVLRVELNGANIADRNAHGLEIRASNCIIRGLVINRFGGDGVHIGAPFVIATTNRVLGCFIGTNATGSLAAANRNGVWIGTGGGNLIGGIDPGDRNIVSGNTAGVVVDSSTSFGNVIANNYIGTERRGFFALLNNFGIQLNGASGTVIFGNLIASRSPNPAIVELSTTGGNGFIQANRIGTDVAGQTTIGYSGIRLLTRNNAIGGTFEGAANCIAGTANASGADAYIELRGAGATGNVVEGNFVGVDILGSKRTGTAAHGIVVGGARNTIGGTAPEARNVIVATNGIALNGAAPNGAHVVQGNLIGVKANGTDVLATGVSGSFGVQVIGENHTVGGSESGSGNVIAGFGRGVLVGSSTNALTRGNRISGNAIFANAWLGIDLVGPGDAPHFVTPNDDADLDTGANELQNYPVLTSISRTGGNVRIAGTLNSKPNSTYRIEFFGNRTVDPSGFGEGQFYLGTVDVTTDATGNAAFDVTLAAPAEAQSFSTTATDSDGNTSEFSAGQGQLLNISTRARVQTGENVLIGGFIVTGTQSKAVIVRAIGPSLNADGQAIPGRLEDPVLELLNQSGNRVAMNDNWKESQEAAIRATGIPPQHDLESAIVRTLEPGAYTAIVRGKGDATGIALVEVYDLAQSAPARLANISTRAFVETGDDVMIGGFIIGPEAVGNTKLVIRALGPSLAAAGVARALEDPIAELRDGSGTLIARNDNWKENQAAVEATGLQPQDERESVLVPTLAPGSYTVIVSGKNDTTGVGLVELYNVQ